MTGSIISCCGDTAQCRQAVWWFQHPLVSSACTLQEALPGALGSAAGTAKAARLPGKLLSAGICNLWGIYKTRFSPNKPIQEAKCSCINITQVPEELKRVPDTYQRRANVGQAERCQLPAHANLGLAQGRHGTLCRHSVCHPCPGWAFPEENYFYPSLIVVPIPVWDVLEELFEMFWRDHFFSFIAYIITLFLVSL